MSGRVLSGGNSSHEHEDRAWNDGRTVVRPMTRAANSSMKISIRLVDGTVEGPTEAREVRDSFLSGKISLDAMIMPEGEPAVWIPITSIFDAGTSLNQSLRCLARERMFNGLNAWLKFAAWILVTACVACLAVFLGVGLIVGELSKGPIRPGGSTLSPRVWRSISLTTQPCNSRFEKGTPPIAMP